MKGNLIIISSPSGGGKGTLIRAVLKTIPNIGYSVSYTTRQMREGEENGRDYFFVSRAEFSGLIEKEEFLEFAEVHGNLYGTSIVQVQKEIENGNDVILEIDVQGAESIRRKMPDAVSIFILPPSFEVLRNRLINRATEKRKDLSLRLRNSINEVRQYEYFDYVVINDDVEKATADLQTVISAERLKRDRQTEAIQGILGSFDISKIITLGEQT
ncbi:MAG: guanylate kinase [Acidobacteria bacterium]|jgi:guanylate kinase|nr:guanylate kinase [Acidobacteriota bacterium]